MSNRNSSPLRSSVFDFVGLEGVRTGLVAVHRAEAERRREAVEAQARQSRRNLTNPKSYALCAQRAKSV